MVWHGDGGSKREKGVRVGRRERGQMAILVMVEKEREKGGWSGFLSSVRGEKMRRLRGEGSACYAHGIWAFLYWGFSFLISLFCVIKENELRNLGRV